MTKPVISVIIPAYNAQEYLRECLESVLAQSFTDFEVIVINDGSVDNTQCVADEFAARDSRVKVFVTENCGVSSARNTGIEVARGEWIFYLDSDDEVLPDAFETLYSIARKAAVKIVAGAFTAENKGGGNGNFKILTVGNAIETTLYQHRLDILNPSACGKLFHRDVLYTNRFTVGKRYEDLDFFYRAYHSTDKVAVTDKVVYFYRDNGSSFINTFTADRLEVLNVTARIEDFVNKNYPQLLPAARDRRLSANFNMFALLMLNTGDDEYINEKNLCWNLIGSYRLATLFSVRTRLKNKVGVILSLLGKRVFIAAAKKIYK